MNQFIKSSSTLDYTPEVSHLKNDGWKTRFSFEDGKFSVALSNFVGI